MLISLSLFINIAILSIKKFIHVEIIFWKNLYKYLLCSMDVNSSRKTSRTRRKKNSSLYQIKQT